MKIFLAQQNYIIGDFEHNLSKIKDAIEKAIAQNGELIVFSELSICGYPPRDFLEFNDFIARCEKAIENLLPLSKKIGIIIGAPERNPKPEGKDLFNAGFLLSDGKIQGRAHKTLLPTYDIFDEYRYFEPAFEWNCINFKGKKLAMTVCEDIWNLHTGNENMIYNPLYRVTPMDELAKQNPDVMINLSASPFDYTHAEDRLAMVKANVKKYKLPMIYCCGVGSQTEVVFDGGSLVFDKEANLIKEGNYFEEELIEVNLTSDGHFEEEVQQSAMDVPSEELTPPHYDPNLNIDRIYDALVMGIKDYFDKLGFKKATLGASGGVDSALTQALAVAALGKENVHAILMPSQFSSDHSVNDAEQLSINLGNKYDTIPIKPLYDAFMKQLAPHFNDLPFNVAEENIQARSRGNLLMAMANKFGYILLNTSNKSELAVGYGTLYGDMAGGISVIGDVYKMQAYRLCEYINKKAGKEIIPQNIIDKAPSAELRPDQKDSDSLPEYMDLDTILYQYIELRQGPKEIIALGYDEALVNRILKMVNRNEYKRNQFCPIIRISFKSFGVGRRIPIVGKYLE
jgi:NAD+ synthase (glutamine-hydrolysing)